MVVSIIQVISILSYIIGSILIYIYYINIPLGDGINTFLKLAYVILYLVLSIYISHIYSDPSSLELMITIISFLLLIYLKVLCSFK